MQSFHFGHELILVIYNTKVPALKPWELTGALNDFSVHSTKTENVQKLLPQDKKLLVALTFPGSPSSAAPTLGLGAFLTKERYYFPLSGANLQS